MKHTPVNSHAASPSHIHMRFDTAPRRITCASQAIAAFLEMHSHDADLISDLSLVMVEILTNIHRHAYEERSGGPVDLEIQCFQAHYVMKLYDLGKPMPEDKFFGAQPNPSEAEIVDLPEGGFGLGLIASLCDEVDYQRIGKRNEWVLQKRVHCERAAVWESA